MLTLSGFLLISCHTNFEDSNYNSFTSFNNVEYRVSLSYPLGWEQNESYLVKYEGEEGYFQLSATNGDSIDTVVDREANHKLKPYGNEPQIDNLTIDNNEARLISPSDDQPLEMQLQSSLIVRYPNSVEIDNRTYHYFILWADKDHIRKIANSIKFLD